MDERERDEILRELEALHARIDRVLFGSIVVVSLIFFLWLVSNIFIWKT